MPVPSKQVTSPLYRRIAATAPREWRNKQQTGLKRKLTFEDSNTASKNRIVADMNKKKKPNILVSDLPTVGTSTFAKKAKIDS